MYSDRGPGARDDDDFDPRDVASSRRGGARLNTRGRAGREYVRGGGGRGRASFPTRGGATVSAPRTRSRPDRPEKTEHKFSFTSKPGRNKEAKDESRDEYERSAKQSGAEVPPSRPAAPTSLKTSDLKKSWSEVARDKSSPDADSSERASTWSSAEPTSNAQPPASSFGTTPQSSTENDSPGTNESGLTQHSDTNWPSVDGHSSSASANNSTGRSIFSTRIIHYALTSH